MIGRAKSKTLCAALAVLMIGACTAPENSGWHVMLSHDADGSVESGSVDNIVAAVRSGCQLRVAWGARRAADPSQTIEHIAEPIWVSIRNGDSVEIQLDNFLINHSVLGEPEAEHPRRERFGGTSKTVMWRANLKTDGSFDAIWYSPQTGKLITRIPQQHRMKWFADCQPGQTEPLFPPAN